MPIVSMGTTFKKTAGSNVASLTSIDGVSVSSETIESTALDNANGYRSFVTSLKDGGEITLSGHFETAHSSFLTDFEAGSTGSYVITFPGGTSWTFSAVVTAFSTSVELEDLVSMEITLKVSGKPVLA
jgi:predicted secreted protein